MSASIQAKSLAGAWYGLATMILAAMSANAIIALMPLLTESMKHDLALSDVQIGALRGIGTTLITAVASYPIGWLADRVDRRLIFAACAVIWSAATAASGLVHTYQTLFLCAMGIAVGEAVLGPVIYALMPDLFPSQKRMLANSVFFVSQLLGIAVGLAVAGLIIGAIDANRAALPAGLTGLATWRIALIAHALPVFVVVPMILLIPLPRERRRLSTSEAAPSGVAVLPYLRAHARTLFPIFIGFGAIGAANFTVFGWIAVAIVRQFNVTPSSVGIILGGVFAASSVLGVVVANWLGRRFARREPETAPLRVAQIGAAAAAALSCLYLVASTPTQFYVITLFQIAASLGGLTLSPTIIQCVAPTAIRARVFAVSGLFYTIFGALSPLAVGLVSDVLGPSPRNLVVAMLTVGIPGFVLGIGLLQIGARCLADTIGAVRVADGEVPSRTAGHVAPAGVSVQR